MSNNVEAIKQKKNAMMVEETNSEADDAESEGMDPVSRAQPIEIEELIGGPPEEKTPADFSEDEDDNPAALALNR